ncbi:hypothetical protein [Aminobacter niigataensis]|uniref:hypothetical protein n=1 Tax=Aminobacter niigataensis TaxID=83265 RepID=UPI0024C7572E|nr:hypothetical protein [Aminobacter niigataensis]CAI2936129.1 conserved protein of unknown function [Aminobacter niigataensis]
MPANADLRFYRIKAAQRDLIAMAGGVERAADVTSFSKSVVGRWNHAADHDLMPISAVLALEAECGVPLVTSAMADLNGRRLADPDAMQVATGNILARHAETCRHAAELMATGAASFADGKVTPSEAAEMDRAASRMEHGLAELRKTLAGARAGGLSIVEGGAK